MSSIAKTQNSTAYHENYGCDLRSPGRTPMNHLAVDSQSLDLVARAMHERARERIPECPAWEDLDMMDPWHAGLIRLAYDRAHDFIAMSGESAG